MACFAAFFFGCWNSLGVPSDQPQLLCKLLPFPACKYTCYSVALISNLCFVLSQSLSSAVVVTRRYAIPLAQCGLYSVVVYSFSDKGMEFDVTLTIHIVTCCGSGNSTTNPFRFRPAFPSHISEYYKSGS